MNKLGHSHRIMQGGVEVLRGDDQSVSEMFAKLTGRQFPGDLDAHHEFIRHAESEFGLPHINPRQLAMVALN